MARVDDADLLLSALGLEASKKEAIARRLAAIGGLPGLWAARSPALGGELGPPAERRVDAILALLDRLLASPLPATQLADAGAVADHFRTRLALQPVESFWVLMLDVRGRLLGEECVAIGTLSACLVHPREIFAPALRLRAAQVILVHNHPSGDTTPSAEDLELTERLTEAGQLLGIPVIDHVIVARSGHRSLGLPQPRARRAGRR
ncbi:MAG: JAB domain-containing protein [Deltaproteobacteria bacterium]|nr:JAB domain-containing protein [Deltaproteobacteria bacterium]